jgi:cell division protein FtsN
MKHLLLVLFAGLLLNMHVFAQWDTYNYDDYDDEYDDEPETSNPGTTNITVNNSGVEDQVEQKLTLPNNQPIYLYFYNTVQNPNPPEPAAQPVETKVEQKPPVEPEPLIEYRYIPAPAPEPPPPPPPVVEYRYIPPPPVEFIYVQPPQPQVEYVYIQPPMPEPVYVQPAPLQIRVIPCLPDPNTQRIFRIQVGSYAVHNTADMMAQRLMAAGLQAGIEYYNSLKRVFVPGVRAEDAYTIVQKLELLGFTEVWIRD